jgi:hypothetical protein
MDQINEKKLMVMDSKTKLKLFNKYDFSKFSLIQKSRVDEESPEAGLFHGIAAVVQNILMLMEILADEKIQDIAYYRKLEDRICKNYGRLQLPFQGIDWKEIDPKDPDFGVFFKMRQLIKDLGKTLNSLFAESKKELRIRNNSPDYQKFLEQIKEIGKAMQNFAEIKERLTEEECSCLA